MLIPLIPKDTDANDFTCHDGEIEFMTTNIAGEGGEGEEGGEKEESSPSPAAGCTGYDIRYSLSAEGDYPTFNIRIPLGDGEKEKAVLMLQGQSARVDATSAQRITNLIVQEAASEFSRISIDYRRVGLHLLPFRVYGMIRQPDGSLTYPSPQAVILPAEYPPHPEITASSVTDDTLTLSLRITVRPQRLGVSTSKTLPTGCSIETYVSYPIYIPKSDEITGSLGSVRSATEGNTMGIRFAFLSTSNLKYSVAAPEKYYHITGNAKTGYRIASKAADAPDYSCYAQAYGYVAPFPAETLLAAGSGADPLDWIADWEAAEDGYLPKSLPYIYRSIQAGSATSLPEVIDNEYIRNITTSTGLAYMLLTRPMTFASAEKSRRAATRKGVKEMRILGLPAGKCLAVLLGSDDGAAYQPLRQWNPHSERFVMSPRRLFHRLLLLSEKPFSAMAVEIIEK